MRSIPVLLTLLTLGIILFAIAIGPADLYEKDQPKTLAYTVDVLVNGRWALPRDVIYQPATKPPLYNWIAASVMWATGSWSETAMKSPSLLSGVGVGAILLLLPRWIGASTDRRDAIRLGALAAALWFACGIDIRHGSTLRMMYLARPDMLQAFCLTAAWAIATGLFAGSHVGATPASSDAETNANLDSTVARGGGKPRTLPILFWLCVASSILSKGPMALLAILFIPLGAITIARSWRAIFAFRPLIGFTLLFLIVGSWFGFAYRADPDHVRSVMLGAEIVNRVTNQTPEGIEKPFYFSSMWFLTKGGPVCVLGVIGGVIVLVRSIRTAASAGLAYCRVPRGNVLVDPRPDEPSARVRSTCPGAPVESEGLFVRATEDTHHRLLVSAALWIAILLIGLSLPAGKRIDYLLPTFAPAALLAAFALIDIARRLRFSPTLSFAVPVALACFLGYARTHTFHEAREHWSDRATAFAHEVRKTVGDEPLLVLVRGKHPLTSLLRRHPGSYLTIDDLKSTHWLILPTANTHATPVLTSEPLPIGFETIETRPLGPLGLYRAGEADSPTLDELTALMESIAHWSADENPYHAPGTVWRPN